MAPRKKFQVPGPVMGEYRVDDLFKNNPKFVIINMEDNKGVIKAVDLAKDLFDQGIKNVRFCDDICGLPEVKTMMEMHKNEMQQNGGLNGMVQPVSMKNEAPNGNATRNGKTILSSGEIVNENMENRIAPGVGTQQPSTSEIQVPSFPLTIPFSLPPTLAFPNMIQYLPKAAIDPAGLFGSLLSDPKFARPPKPSPAKKEAARKRKSEKDNPLPEEFMACLLCREMVQITKEVAMRKHIKMHLDIRAFKCTECQFGSEQWNAVISHMKLVHKTEKEAPINEEKEKDEEIKVMVDRLFPTRNFQLEILRMAQVKKNVQNVFGVDTTSGMGTEKKKKEKSTFYDQLALMQIINNMLHKQDTEPSTEDGQPEQEQPALPEVKKYQCFQCNRNIKCYAGYEVPSDGPLANHLRNHHSDELVVYKCPICHWKNEVEYKVRRHIVFRHSAVASQTHPLKVENGRDWRMYLRRNYTQLAYNGILPLDEEDLDLQTMQEDKDMKIARALVLQKFEGVPVESDWVPPSKRVKEEDMVTLEED